jgi:hypothetical protein
MTFEPQSWTAERYLGRAESGRTRPLRLSCSRQSEAIADDRESAEFFAKFLGLPEITEQSLFAEMMGNILARSCGITTGEPAFIEIDESFSDFLRHVDIRVNAGLGVGSRNLGSGIGPPTFGRMSAEQVQDAARLYIFDLFVQNPDRRLENANCLVVSRQLVAIDFEACFSFLYPIIGMSAHPWEVSKQGIARRHLFHGELREAGVEWPMLVQAMLAEMMNLLHQSEMWLPSAWMGWAGGVRDHVSALRAHEQQLVFEVVGSLS